jgi:hypothetical protein
MIGCLPMDSMFQSTLECLYDRNCLYMISQIMSTQSYLTLAIHSTHFQPINTTTLDSMFGGLFIEEWHRNVSYEAYFNACRPIICSYTLSKHFDILYAVSMLLTIYGGLDIVLKIVIPIAFKLGGKCLLLRTRQDTPMNIS